MALPENVQAVQALVEVLSPKVIGRELPGWSCCCGAVKGAAAIATEIQPAGDIYPGQETSWATWTVKMQPKPGEVNGGWSCGLSDFVPAQELKELFEQHFGTAA